MIHLVQGVLFLRYKWNTLGGIWGYSTTLLTYQRTIMESIQNQIARVFSDPFQFIQRLQIVNKAGRVVPLELNAEQIEIINALEQGRDTLVLKPRQIGSSTVVCAYMFWKAYTSTTPLTLIILSYKIASSKHLLHIHKRFYQYLPEGLKRELEVDNTTELAFKGGGRIIAAAATQAGGLRSQTCSMLHLSLIHI